MDSQAAQSDYVPAEPVDFAKDSDRRTIGLIRRRVQHPIQPVISGFDGIPVVDVFGYPSPWQNELDQKEREIDH